MPVSVFLMFTTSESNVVHEGSSKLSFAYCRYNFAQHFLWQKKGPSPEYIKIFFAFPKLGVTGAVCIGWFRLSIYVSVAANV